MSAPKNSHVTEAIEHLFPGNTPEQIIGRVLEIHVPHQYEVKCRNPDSFDERTDLQQVESGQDVHSCTVFCQITGIRHQSNEEGIVDILTSAKMLPMTWGLQLDFSIVSGGFDSITAEENKFSVVYLHNEKGEWLCGIPVELTLR